jgi:hypothetical protein
MRLVVKVAVVTVAVVTAALLLLAAPAGANTKQTSIVPLDFTLVFAPGDLCSFAVTLHQGPGLVKVDDFFDSSGTLYKEITTNYGGRDLLTLSANGTTLTTVETFSDITYFNPDGSIARVADSGINDVFTVPHHGAVTLIVGRIVYDANFNPIFVAGPGFRTPFNVDALCAALSP